MVGGGLGDRQVASVNGAVGTQVGMAGDSCAQIEKKKRRRRRRGSKQT